MHQKHPSEILKRTNMVLFEFETAALDGLPINQVPFSNEYKIY